MHEKNRELFTQWIEPQIKEERDETQFFKKIDVIGRAALQLGLDLRCYKEGFHAESSEVCFGVYPLWEGGSQKNLCFLLFAWPALKSGEGYSPYHQECMTPIHSHPIPCAYSVLSGRVTERKFELISNSERKIRLKDKKEFSLGDKSVDLNREPFIHQLLNEEKDSAPSISLHVYKAASREELSRIFLENREEHLYPESTLQY